MTVVFVHGVPDTARVWDRLAARLAPHGVKLALPGFGSETPQGFTACKEDYVAWLIGALEVLPAPLHVIAHDWGSILLLRVLTLRPDLVRTWVGGGAPFTPDYAWHATARMWQTPGAGEKAMQRLTPEIAVGMLTKAGLAEGDAAETARHIDARMRESILALYRSGRDVFREWAPALGRVAAPGLVLWGERDAYAEADFADRLGSVTGARVVRLDCGHWWQVERPDAAAVAISAFWRDAGV